MSIPKRYKVQSQRVPKVYGTSFRKRMLTAASKEDLDQIWSEFDAMGREPSLRAHMHLSAAYRRRMAELGLEIGPAAVFINPNTTKCEFTGTLERPVSPTAPTEVTI